MTLHKPTDFWGIAGSSMQLFDMATSADGISVIRQPTCGSRTIVHFDTASIPSRVKADGLWHNGVASYGRRPTFDNGAPLFEVHLFDFDGDLYEQDLRAHLVSYLRGEEKFESVDALITQMDQGQCRGKGGDCLAPAAVRD